MYKIIKYNVNSMVMYGMFKLHIDNKCIEMIGVVWHKTSPKFHTVFK